MKTPAFMRVWFQRDGGAMVAMVTVPFFEGRSTAEEDAMKVARQQLVGDNWIAVKHERRGNVEDRP